MSALLNTDNLSLHLREKSVCVTEKKILVTNFCGTEQEQDLSEPPNCRGLGRIRHFRRVTSPSWPANPLPIDPACRSLGLPAMDTLRAQVFQNAACNWRCWYCFVPFNLLSANPRYSEWVTPTDLVDLYLNQTDSPSIIDLTGGQPDLVPEWTLWMMQELQSRGLERKVYLWSDDNLSTDYFWRFLSDADRKTIAEYPNYGRVCCFKGFNEESFAFNTKAEPALFERQYNLMSRLLQTGIDIYAYVTVTTPSRNNLADDMRRFMDRLQHINPNLPLRVVPLEIYPFTPVVARVQEIHREALQNQHCAIEIWQSEMEKRFSLAERNTRITDILLSGHTK